ncbi:MAG: RDD family protein [Methanocella sp.]
MATTNQLDLTHWLYRVIALIIDAIIIAIPTAIINFIISAALVGSIANFWYFAWGTWLFLPLIQGVLMLLYFIVLEVTSGATLGKKVLGLRVQTVQGQRVTFMQSLIRNISKIYWLLLLLDWLVGIVTEGDKRQKFADRIAGTIVVSTKQPFGVVDQNYPPPPPPP